MTDIWSVYDIPVSGLNEGDANGVDLLASSLTDSEIVQLMPPVSAERAIEALRSLEGEGSRPPVIPQLGRLHGMPLRGISLALISRSAGPDVSVSTPLGDPRTSSLTRTVASEQ